MFGGFPWPLFPMIGTAIPLLTVQVQRQDLIESHRRRIVRRQEKAQFKAQLKAEIKGAKKPPPELGS